MDNIKEFAGVVGKILTDIEVLDESIRECVYDNLNAGCYGRKENADDVTILNVSERILGSICPVGDTVGILVKVIVNAVLEEVTVMDTPTLAALVVAIPETSRRYLVEIWDDAAKTKKTEETSF